MDTINLSAALSKINNLLPKKLNLEQYIVKRNEVFKTFTLDVELSILSDSSTEMVHGAPSCAGELVDSMDSLDSRSRRYVETNKRRVLQQEFDKYQVNKTSVFIDPSKIVDEHNFYCKCKCEACGSTGHIKCAPCAGTGYVSCSRCHGSGKIYLNDSKTKQPKMQMCNYCNAGRAQCSNCLSACFITCEGCNGETFNSFVEKVYFNTNVVYNKQFDISSNNIFATAIRNMPINKLLTVCKFEQISSSSMSESKFSVSYKASLPVIELELLINNKAQLLTVLSNNGDFGEPVALLDEILQPILLSSTNYLSQTGHENIAGFYKQIQVIPFIKTALNNMSNNAGSNEVLKQLDKTADGHLSKNNLDILAQAIKKSFGYEPKVFFPILTIVLAIPNLFLGAYLAFGFPPKIDKFMWDVGNIGILTFIATSILAIIINFGLLKTTSSWFHKVMLFKTKGAFKKIYQRCFKYCFILSLIGGITASYQYDFVINQYKLIDRYAVKKIEDKKADNASTPAKHKSKKVKKSKH